MSARRLDAADQTADRWATDPEGLVCGYLVDSAGAMRSLAWNEMDEALALEGNLVWLHFNLADASARDWIEHCRRIPPSARKVLLGTDGHMRIEGAGTGITGVVGDLHHEFAGKPDELGVLRLFLDSGCMISARRKPLQAVDKLRQTFGEGLKMHRPIVLLAQLLHHITDTFADLIVGLTGEVDGVEERLLDDRPGEYGEDLGRIRRVVARLRRHMVPQQHALASFLFRLPSWVGEADAADLRGAIERLGALGHDLELVQERARLLGEQASARLMEANNRNLYILSIITTVFLPMTLVTGVFGMNLGGMPGLQSETGFYWGLVAMAVAGVATWYLVRRNRLI